MPGVLGGSGPLAELERLLMVGALAVVVLVLAFAVRALVRRRVAAVIGTATPGRLRAQLSSKGPTLVYFYGPLCVSCTDQARVIEELVQESGTLVLRFDVTKEPALADALGAVTVPTIAVIDIAGRVRHVNLGYHPKAILASQISIN